MNRLVPIAIESIYPINSTKKGLLPERLAQCTPDTRKAVYAIQKEVLVAGGKLRLSDMFRSYEVQLAAHRNKPTLSPAPGGSNHEAGRAFDIDLDVLGIPLKQFWTIAAKYGVSPIISTPNPRLKEAWHFECLGSHRLLRNLGAKYPAISGILDLGFKVDRFSGSKAHVAWLQCALHRLRQNPGPVDGVYGPKTRRATDLALSRVFDYPYYIPFNELDLLVQAKYPEEYD